MHMKIDDDPLAVAERIALGACPTGRRPSPVGHFPVDAFEPRCELIEITSGGL